MCLMFGKTESYNILLGIRMNGCFLVSDCSAIFAI